MREVLTRYGRRNVGFLWLFLEPMMFTLGVAALWSLLRGHSYSNLPIVAFAVTGYSSVLLWRNMTARCIDAVEPNRALMYHRNVKVIDIYLARLLLEVGGATISFTTIVVLFSSMGWMAWPEDVGEVMVGWFMLAWFGMSLALLVGALSERIALIEKIWHPLSYILFPMSGAATLVDALPRTMQDVVLWFPMVHGVELLREGYFGSTIRAHYDLGYMALFCAGLTLLGLAEVRRVSGGAARQ